MRLLATVYRASGESELIQKLIDTGDLFHPVAWKSDETYQFLKEIPLYESSGILCRIPDWWKSRSSGTRINLKVGDSKPSFTGLKAILDFNPEIILGDVPVTEQEARQILEESRGLAFIKNRWIPVDHEKLALALAAYENAREMADDGITFLDAMRMQLNPEKMLGEEGNKEAADVSVSSGEWLQWVMQNMKTPDKVPPVVPADGFKAELRPYQQTGLNWLGFMDTLKLGGCLADDMGLGKTVQVLAFLTTMTKPDYKRTGVSLLIIPASLIANWVNEIHRFFPALSYMIAFWETEPNSADLQKN